MAVRSRVVRRRVEPTEEELAELVDEVQVPDDVEEEPEPVKAKPVVKPGKPVGKPALARKAAPIVEEDPDDNGVGEDYDPDDDDEPELVDVEDLFGQILAGLAEGKAILITRTKAGWAIHQPPVGPVPVDVAPAVAAVPQPKKGLRGKAFDEAVCTPEYLAWEREWGQLTVAEKKAKAKKAGAKWQAHEHPQVELINLAAAYLKHLGIEKFKPDYKSLAARRAIQGK